MTLQICRVCRTNLGAYRSDLCFTCLERLEKEETK